MAAWELGPCWQTFPHESPELECLLSEEYNFSEVFLALLFTTIMERKTTICSHGDFRFQNQGMGFEKGLS